MEPGTDLDSELAAEGLAHFCFADAGDQPVELVLEVKVPDNQTPDVITLRLEPGLELMTGGAEQHFEVVIPATTLDLVGQALEGQN